VIEWWMNEWWMNDEWINDEWYMNEWYMMNDGLLLSYCCGLVDVVDKECSWVHLTAVNNKDLW
jgi:hypothetical protein